MANDINFELKGIGQILAQNRLVVPLNQREYAWEKDHVKELFQDFSNALATGKGGYFLGTIVLTKGSGDNPEVSDGQQRLATTSILIAAIRDYFAEHNDPKRAGAIADEFLRTVDRKTTDTVSKLRLNVDDQEFFRKAIISDPGPKTKAKTKVGNNVLVDRSIIMFSRSVPRYRRKAARWPWPGPPADT